MEVTGPIDDAPGQPDVPRPRGRAARNAGLVGLAAVTLLGLTAGWSGALIFAALYLGATALYAVVRRRSWLGPMRRGTAAALLAGSFVALVVVSATAAPPPVIPPAARTPLPTIERSSPSADPTPTLSPEPTAEAQPTPLPEPDPPADVAATVPAQPPTALATAALLPVKGRAPKTGYDRDLYGQAWKDVDQNGCDTRNDVLRRDLVDQVLKPGSNGCTVASGTLLDPYSGAVIAFVRGQGTSTAVQIDHVVALSDSWQKGAQQWDSSTREAFANDPLNLLAVDGALNLQKGDGDTATWLPPAKAFRCAYVARQVGVKHAYGLWVTQAEQDAMVRVLSTCPTEPLPGGATPPPPVAEAPPAVAPPVAVAEEPAPAPAAPPPPAAVSGPFANCTEAWAAGAAPVLAGDPGYAPKLDRDGDGIGCENRP